MINYLDTEHILNNRSVKIEPQDFVFALSIVLGENPSIAYGLAYDQKKFKKAIGDDEEKYITSVKKEADLMLKQQHIVQLKSELAEAYRADIQQKALSLEQIEFTASDINALLNKLLASQAKDLDSASIREMLQIIHELINNFGLSSGNDAFAKHFITLPPKFNALCTSCNREFNVVGGLDCICPHCDQVYHWVEEEERYYPQPSKL